MQMRYFWKNKGVWAFDETQDALITDDMIELTADELDRHLNPLKYLSDDEREAIRIAAMPKLTRRQFKLMLLNANLLNQVEQLIANTDDMIIKIEYQESTDFLRNNESVLKMIDLLEMDITTVDDLWLKASLI